MFDLMLAQTFDHSTGPRSAKSPTMKLLDFQDSHWLEFFPQKYSLQKVGFAILQLILTKPSFLSSRKCKKVLKVKFNVCNFQP